MPQRTNLQLAVEAYEDALMRGLCHDGALEVALQSADSNDRDRLLHELQNRWRDTDPHEDTSDTNSG